MGRCALINEETGIVENIVMANEDDVAPDGYLLVLATSDSEIGGTWDGSTFARIPVVHVVTKELVDAEKMRRSSHFVFEGVQYQSGGESFANILRLREAAQKAIASIPALPNDLRWYSADRDFVWIAEDNSYNPMDAQKMVAFGDAVATWQDAHLFSARELKNMDPIPLDYRDDKWWP